MYVVTVTGRNRKFFKMDQHGEPVESRDTSPLTITAGDKAAAEDEAKSLLPELNDAPNASVKLPDKTLPLREWLIECKVPVPAPVNPGPGEVIPPVK